MVKSALAVVERWRAASPPGEVILSPPQEVKWFQLLQVKAVLIEDTGDLAGAKAFCERNLMTDPVTTSAGTSPRCPRRDDGSQAGEYDVVDDETDGRSRGRNFDLVHSRPASLCAGEEV